MAESADEFFSQFERERPTKQTPFHKAVHNHIRDQEADQFFSQFEKEQPRTGWAAVGQDVLSSVVGGIKKAPEMLATIGKSIINPHGRNMISDPFDVEGLKRQKAGMKTEEETDPLHNIKVGAAGLATGTRNLANIPANIVDYAKKREIVPDYMNAWRLPEDLKNFNYYEAFGGQPQNESQQFLAGLGEFAPAWAATGGLAGGYPAIAAGAIGGNRNPIEEMTALLLGNKAMQAVGEIPNLPNKIKANVIPDEFRINEFWQDALKNAENQVGQAKGQLGQYEEGAANTYADTLNKLLEQQQQTGAAQEANQFKLNEATGQLELAKKSTAEDFAQGIENATLEEQQLINQLTKQTPPEERAAGTELRAANQEVYNELKNKFDTEYKDFENDNAMLVSDIVPFETIQQDYPLAVEKMSKTTKDALQNTLQPGGFGTPLQDVINLRRSITSAKLGQRRDSINQSLEQSKKDIAREAANELEQIEEQVNGILERNLDPEQYARLKDIDTRYGQLVKPFYAEPMLHETIDKYGSMPSSNFFKSFNKLGPHVDTLLEMLSSNPRWQKAIAANDLAGMDWSNPTNVSKALQGDFGKVLPKEFVETLRKLQDTQAERQLMEEAIKQVNVGELKAIVTEPRMHRVLEAHPEILQQLDNIRTMEEGLKSLEAELKRSGETAAEAKAQVAELKNIWGKLSSANEIKNIVNDPIVSKVLGQHPELQSRIAELRSRQEALRELEAYLEETGMSAKEAKETADKLKKKLTIGTTVAAAAAGGSGLLKILRMFGIGF